MPDFSQLPSVEKLTLALADEVSLPRPLVTGYVKRALEQWRERVRAGGEGAPGYGHLKVRLLEAMDAHFGDARERRREFLADPAEVDRVLARGGEKARERAVATRDRAYAACGLR